MARRVAAREYTIERFITDAQKVLEDHGGPVKPALEEIGERMKLLVARDDLEQIRDRSPDRRLYSEPSGLQLMLATFASTTAVHTHGTWGVMVGYKGRERYTQWVREDDGSRPGFARLRVVEDRIIERGGAGHWFPPPNDIHRQWPEGGPSLELILMGHPPSETRLYFDLEKNTCTEGTPADMHYPGADRGQAGR